MEKIVLSVEQFKDHKNQYLITMKDENNSDIICFQSYRTRIAYYNRNNKTLEINSRYWDYSQTTLKHLKAFINEHCYPFKYENRLQFLKLIETNDNCSWFE